MSSTPFPLPSTTSAVLMVVLQAGDGRSIAQARQKAAYTWDFGPSYQ